MAMFGTTQGTPKTNVSRPERVSSLPKGASPGQSERTKPVATSVSQPNAQPIK
jgi:hypothetical protein